MQPKTGFDAVVAGHICLDIIPGFTGAHKPLKELLLPGRLIGTEGVVISTGGAVANTGLALTKLGPKTLLIGKTGTDYFGDIVGKILDDRGAQHRLFRDSGSRTSYTVILSPPGTDRIFLHDSGANDSFSPDDLDYELIEKARIFHFGYPPAMARMYADGGRELERLLRTVHESGVTTSLDLSLPDPESAAGKAEWKDILRRIMPYVDVFVPSAEEILFMLDREAHERLFSGEAEADPADALDPGQFGAISETLLEWGAGVVMIKCGRNGLYLRTGSRRRLEKGGRGLPADLAGWAGREVFEESFEVLSVVSATGAGDASIAGFLASLLQGDRLEKALRTASAVGALCVQHYDAVSGVRTLEETWNAVVAGWEKNRLRRVPEGWSYDQTARLWEKKKD